MRNLIMFCLAFVACGGDVNIYYPSDDDGGEVRPAVDSGKVDSDAGVVNPTPTSMPTPTPTPTELVPTKDITPTPSPCFLDGSFEEDGEVYSSSDEESYKPYTKTLVMVPWHHQPCVNATFEVDGAAVKMDQSTSQFFQCWWHLTRSITNVLVTGYSFNNKYTYMCDGAQQKIYWTRGQAYKM